MFKNTPKTYFMGGATPTDRTMINRGVFFMGGADTSSGGGWSGKPASWPDIRKNLIPNSIRLFADERYPLGFTATATGGYTVKIDGELKGTYASGAQCSIPQTDWPKGHINSLTAYGATEQSETPTPTTPQDIVCNNGVLKYSLNELNPSDIEVGYYRVQNTGVLTENPYNFVTGYMPVKPDQSYVFFGRRITDNRLSSYNRIHWFDANKEFISTNNYTKDNVGAGTAPSNAYFAQCSCNESGATSREITQEVVDGYNWIFQQGTAEVTYVPYVEGGIYTDGTVETIEATGNNLLDVSTITENMYITDNGGIDSNNKSFYSALIPVEPNTKYVFSKTTTAGGAYSRIHGYDENGEWQEMLAKSAATSDLTLTCTTNTNTKYIRVSSKLGDDLKVNELSTATAEMLLEVGDYQDEQEILSGAVTRNAKVLVLDGVTDGKKMNPAWNSTYKRGNINLQDNAMTPVATADAYCTHFVYDASVNGNPTSSGFCTRDTDHLMLFSFLGMSDINSATDANAWLADQYANGTPVIVVYPLATPTTETVTPQALTGTSATVTAGSISDLQISYTNTERGYHIDYPTGAETAHIVDIYPTTEGNNITAFHCSRVAASGNEQQGVLWGHLNISNSIDLSKGFSYTEYYNNLMEALTCKGNKLTLLGCDYCFYGAESLEYVPQKTDYSSVSNMTNYITNASNLGKTDIEANSTTLTKLGTYGDSTHFIGGINSVRVSNEAPFSDATPSQINVSYTGMDRNALVTLFDDLPTVSDGQIINVTGCTGAQEKLTIVGNPSITEGIVSGFSNSNYLKLKNPDLNNDFEINIKVDSSTLCAGTLIGTNNYYYQGIYFTNAGKFVIRLSGTDNSMIRIDSGEGKWSAGNTYILNATRVDNTLTFTVKENGTVVFTDSATIPADFVVRTIYEYDIGKGPDGSWSGSVDLNETYVKISNELFFGREQYLLPEDIEIATDKGWTVTGGPAFTKYYAYTNENDTNLYTSDNPVNEGTFSLQNASVVGTLTENDGVYSGFSSGNYILETNSFRPQSNTWEKTAKFIYTSTTGGFIFGEGTQDYQKPALGTENNKFLVYISSNGTSWNIASGVRGTNTLTANVPYFVKFGWNGTHYYVDYSTDGINYTRDISISSNNPIADTSTESRIGNSYGIPFQGSIDLKYVTTKIGDTVTNYYQTANASTLYNNSLQQLNPQPVYAVAEPSLKNCANISCTDLGNGKFSAGSGQRLQTTNSFNLSSANSWELETVYKYSGGGTEPLIAASGTGDFCGFIFLFIGGELKLYLTSTSNSWQYGAIPMGITAVNNEVYHFKLGYNTTDGYYLDYYKESDQTQSYTRVWNNTSAGGTAIPLSFKIRSSNFQFLNWGLNYNYYYSSGYIDMSNTKLTVDSVEYTFYNPLTSLFVNSDFYTRNSSRDINN